MSIPGFYSLSSAWLFLMLVPLVLLYFLKLKRARVEIPSLVLWRQVINDRRVNSPFQKFKRNLLLLLQLLLMTLLVLAAMQPFVHSGTERAEYLPVLIDCSASMAAVDEPGGKSRLEIAKDRAGQLIDNLLPDQRLSLIAVNSTARRLTDFTDNKRLLRNALENIQITDVASDLEDALRMSEALAQTVPIETVVIYSDGNFPARVDFELPFRLNYQQLPAAGPNVGITALSARRSTSDEWDVFARVQSSSEQPLYTEVELRQDGEVIGQGDVDLEPRGAQRLVFHVRSPSASSLEFRLLTGSADSLLVDNMAFLDLPAGRPLAVYCPWELVTFRHALQVLEGLAVYPQSNDARESLQSRYDLLITDRADKEGLDATVTLWVGIIPDPLQELISLQTGGTEFIDWQRISPLLQHIQLSDVLTSDEPRSARDVSDGDFEALGFEILAHGRAGPLVLRRRSSATLDYFLLFHPDRSTLPFRVGFPILVANVVKIAFQQASLSEIRGATTGVLPRVTLGPQRTYQVMGPRGIQQAVTSNAAGVISGVPAPYVGRYVVRENGNEVRQVGVGLLNAQETGLKAVEEIQFRELAVSAATTDVKSDRPLWPLLASVAFCLLLVEWWYFHRRPVRVSV